MKIGELARSKKTGQLFRLTCVTQFHIFMRTLSNRKNMGTRLCRKDKFDKYYELQQEEKEQTA